MILLILMEINMDITTEIMDITMEIMDIIMDTITDMTIGTLFENY